jgi:hypothetical protein
MTRARLNIFHSRPSMRERLLGPVAAEGRVQVVRSIAAALASFLSPDAGDQREAAIAKRLDRLSRQFDRLERDQNIADRDGGAVRPLIS